MHRRRPEDMHDSGYRYLRSIPSPAEIEAMCAAARSAAAFVREELAVRIDSHTLGGDLATIDETEGGIIGEAMDCLARLEAALGPFSKEVPDAG